MFALVPLTKSKFITLVALMLFVLHSCRTRVALVALVSLMSHTCCTRVARVALVSSLSGTRVVKF